MPSADAQKPSVGNVPGVWEPGASSMSPQPSVDPGAGAVADAAGTPYGFVDAGGKWAAGSPYGGALDAGMGKFTQMLRNRQQRGASNNRSGFQGVPRLIDRGVRYKS